MWNLQVIYVDDLHIVVVGKDKFVVLWMALAAYELMGTPFAYHKFKGGLEVEFVGYSLSYKHACAGISPKRTAWVLGWIEEVKGNNWFVQGRRLHEFLGRLNFVARVLTWIKPFLAPIYAFNAVLKRGTVARLPEMVYLTLIFISEQLEASKGMQSVLQEWMAPRETFRADAKCERVGSCWEVGCWVGTTTRPWHLGLPWRSSRATFPSSSMRRKSHLGLLRVLSFLRP